MKRSTRAVLLMVVAAALMVAAFSAPASAQYYAGVRGGVFLPNSAEEGLDEFDAGFSAEGFAGFRFTPNLALEAGAGYYQSKWEDEDDVIPENNTVSSIPVTLTAKAFLPLAERASLYAGAGVGAYFAKAEVEGSWKEESLDILATDTATDTAFGYHFVVGGEYQVSPRLGLEVQAKWFKADPSFSFFEGTASLTEVEPDIGGVVLSLGLVFLL